ncbi:MULTISPECIES: hypothetical protein [Thermodesulfovibrio]|jgi:hypothetical protein|uniref:hypothetical protein n=1 Tax=Thermodesulfovibrio TaxID=28261 RepID=UPI002636B955|nr:hypothetical protein [Thermodesulfovibrio sp.]
MKFEKTLNKLFGKFYKEDDFIKVTFEKLKKYDFTYENAIASVCLCRDEICQPVIEQIRKVWGEAFNFASLAGLFTAGKTGMKAFISHAPAIADREHYVFYAFSHVAIDENGIAGVCKRKGLESSHACGALCNFHGELLNGKLNLKLDEDDMEMSFLRRRMLREIKFGEVPDLISLTKTNLYVILSDLEQIIKTVVDSKKADYAVFSGIQVHGPEENYIVPDDSYVSVNGRKKKLEI